jgi:hypothetical protein
MRTVRKLLLVIVAAIAISPITGCCGVGTTEEENWRNVCRVADYDARMLVDDLSLFAQTHRTMRTSRWIID